MGKIQSFYTFDPVRTFLYVVTNSQPNLNLTWISQIQSDNFLQSNSLISKFVVISNGLPILSTQIPSVTDHPTGIYSSYKFLFELYQPTVDTRSIINAIDYNQQGYPRLYELQGNTPLDFLDVRFMYVDHLQNLNQIYVSNNNCCAISFVFIKKSLFNKYSK